MYGTIARLKVDRSKRDELRDLMRQWERDLRPQVAGAEGGFLLLPDDEPDRAYLIAMFDDEESYRANAATSDQDAWYRRLREVLDADPEWIDGEFWAAAA